MISRLQSHRVPLSVAAIIVVVGLGAGFVLWTSNRAVPASATSATGATLMIVDLADGRDDVERVDVDAPDGPRSATGLRCLRVYSAAGTTVCMKLAGVGPTYSADITDSSGRVVRSVALPGVPSRARVSASGNVVSWTSFVTGDSYSTPGGFSTRTGIFDMRTGRLTESVEHFQATIEGQPLSALDVNYWGVTVADDDHTFYATLATAGRTWLVRGDLQTEKVASVRPDAECPSLSPDGTRVAYKKRVSRLGPWNLAVLDLATGVESRLPGTVGIDDQAEWLDNGRLAYGATLTAGGATGIYVAPANGSVPGRLLIPDAASPSIAR